MNSPEQIAERVLSVVRSTHEALLAELSNVPDDVIATARTSLHELTKAMPGPSVTEVEAARERGEAAPTASPEKWVGWTAVTMMASLWRARRDE